MKDINGPIRDIEDFEQRLEYYAQLNKGQRQLDKIPNKDKDDVESAEADVFEGESFDVFHWLREYIDLNRNEVEQLLTRLQQEGADTDVISELSAILDGSS